MNLGTYGVIRANSVSLLAENSDSAFYTLKKHNYASINP